MTNLILIIGRSGSGKSTLEYGLIERYPNLFHKVVSVTTRPRRDGEIDGADYHFFDDNEFNEADLIERETFGSNNYGSFRRDFESDKKYTTFVMVPGVLKKLKKTLETSVSNVKNIFIVYFDITEDTLYENMIKRGDSHEYIINRLEHDTIDKVFIRQGVPADITITDDMLNDELVDCVFNGLERVGGY